ncbi:hypothetical protein ABTM04_21265, partial [Acinetobacter baumannii]
FEVDARSGLRLSADCGAAHARATRQVARWPALASPWLSAAQRQAARLPPLAPDCAPDGRESAGELRIEGVHEGATL